MNWRTFVFAWLFICPLVIEAQSLVPASEINVALKDPPKCGRTLGKLKKLGLILMVGAAVVYAPSIYHGLNAASQGREHLAFGIYFSMDDILKILNEGEKEVLKNPQLNARAIVEILSQKLYGDYEFDRKFDLLPKSRLASEFFDGQSKKRGVCRHKAMILAVVLNKLGIKAQIELGQEAGHEFHVWVHIPELDLIADPTQNIILPREEYLKKEAPHWRSTILKSRDWKFTVIEKGWVY